MATGPDGGASPIAFVGIVVIVIAIVVAVASSPRDLSMMAASTNGAILGLALVIIGRR